MESEYFDQVRTEIQAFLPAKMDLVLEIGCASGQTLQWLHEKCGAKYTVGIELFEAAAKEAEARCNEVYVADIASSTSVLERFENRVDLLLLLDILEHLVDPGKSLRSMKTVLNENGVVIASIPNVRSVKVLLPLIFLGKFEYSNSGILDKTHLRFFSKSSICKMFTDNGFNLLSINANGPLHYSTAKTTTGRIIAIINYLTFGFFEGILANQWLVVAKNKLA